MDDHDVTGLTPGHGSAQCCDGKAGGHPLVEGVADDPVAEDVLNRAAVELSFCGGVLGDVGQPEPVRGGGGELALDEVVVHGRSGRLTATPSALLGRGGPDPLLGAQPPDPPFADDQAVALELVGQEPVAELRIIGVGVEQHVDDVRVVPVPVGDGLGEPGVVGLRAEANNPAGQPHGDALGGQVTDQRVGHFGSNPCAK